MEINTIALGEALKLLKKMPSEIVNCTVTSPPYFRLRDYGVEGQIGMEETPEKFIRKLVRIFNEVYRVTTKDGTLWLNIGDSYNNNSIGNRNELYSNGRKKKSQIGKRTDTYKRGILKSLKQKDLISIPWMLAFALRKSGWYLRQDIIWHKPNPMPESVTDRCSKAHEYVFLFSKSKKYFFDNYAIQEVATGFDNRKDIFTKGSQKYSNGYFPSDVKNQSVALKRHLWWRFKNLQENGQQNHSMHERRAEGQADEVYPFRNKRSVWTVPTQAFSEAHFATFPERLAWLCISAGSSEQGCCSKCHKQYTRVLKPTEEYAKILGKGYFAHANDAEAGMQQMRGNGVSEKLKSAGSNCAQYESVGWKAGCKCKDAEIIPAVIFDPFAGAGTAPLVGRKLQRNFYAIELKPAYKKLSDDRLKKELGLFI